MTRDDIIRMAREATDEPCPYDNGSVTWSFTKPELERFAALVAAATRESMRAGGWRSCAVGQRETQHCGLLETAVLAEREACARMAEECVDIERLADAIRARGEQQTPQERTADYLEKCPNCNGPADNGFDRSWPDPNPYYCTKCMKAMEY